MIDIPDFHDRRRQSMRSTRTLVLAGLAVAALPAGLLLATEPLRMVASPKFLKGGETRNMQISYAAHVKDVPAGTRVLRVWVPVPQDTPVQAISGLKFEGATQPEMRTETRFGNRIAYFEVKDPAATFDAIYGFGCARKEQVTDIEALKEDGREDDAAAAEFLRDDRLTVVDDTIRKMAADATAGKRTTVEKARAIYDLVLERMTYDRSGTGWGRGDSKFACEVGKGNCTDFHAMFMSLCRASGIAAGFEIGLYPPYKRHSDEKLGGYHCWSFFRVPGKTWVPVDCSEADKNPAMKEYFFGGHTSNRVTLSVGRDLVLEPRQDGPPLNYLLNPYAEADGKPVAGVSKDWTCKDVD
jgi:transglutaminase-like putative cysteine protease